MYGRMDGRADGWMDCAGARKLTNPMLRDEDEEGDEAKDSSEDMSTAQMIAANESEMDDDELEDLTYAFQAADLGGEGVITDAEFGVMVRVMGCEMTEEDVRKVIAEAVDGFSSECAISLFAPAPAPNACWQVS